MIPSQPNLHRGHWGWQAWDHHPRHPSWGWPQAGEAAGAASSAAANAAEAGGIASFGGGPPYGPKGMHYHYYHGRGWPPRRFGFMRRFVWFGLGAFGASMWFRHKEKCKEWDRAIAFSATQAGNSYNEKRSCPKPNWSWKHTESNTPNPSTPSYNSRQPNVTSPPGTPSTQSPEEAIKSAVMAELLASYSPETATQKNDKPSEDGDKKDGHRSWSWSKSWGDRHRKWHAEMEAKIAQRVADQQAQYPMTGETEAKSTSGAAKQEQDMKRLKEAIETAWDEKKGQAIEAQQSANQQARDYARQKIDKLSTALDALRDSLSDETDRKVQEATKKLV